MGTDLECVARILAQVEDIPTLPVTVAAVLRIIDDPDCSVRDLGEVITSDPSLAARVLRLANSAYYGFPRAIAAVPQAITLLGFATLRNVALSTAVFDLLRPTNGNTLDLEALWRHSIGVAAAAKLVARCARYTPLEKAFTAGLLHDIGKLLIARYLSGSVGEIVGLIASEGITIGDAEQRVLGVAHPAFGAWLAARWAFPPSLVDAIAFHHHPERAEDNLPLAGLLSVADTLTHRAAIGSGGDPLPRAFDPIAVQALGLSESDLAELDAALFARRDDIETFAATLGRH